MDRRRRIAFRAMFAAYMVWQITAVLHIVAVEHHLCPHGKIVHDHSCDHDRASQQDHTAHHGNEGDEPGDEDHRPHDHCKLLLTLTAASVMASGLVSVNPQAVLPHEQDPEIRVVAAGNFNNVLDVSPSHSPPLSNLS